MNRKQMIEFVNNNIMPGAEIANDDWFYNGKQIFLNIIKAISAWRIGKPADIHMDGQIRDGVLYLNGEVVKRVAAKLPRVPYDAGAAYWEGRCLEKGEVLD